MTSELSPSEQEQVRQVFDRVNEQGWGLALGALAAVGLFAATVVLVIKGGPSPGAHLALLGIYFPGYSVSWPGAVVGFAYAFAAGYVGGRVIAKVYNRLVPRS